MVEDNYTIYTTNRPTKVVFLISSARKIDDSVDTIVKYCQSKWGGRFYPILISNNGELSQDDYNFLKDYDPDFIKCIDPVSNETLEKIDRNVTSFYIQELDKEDHINRFISDSLASLKLTYRNFQRLKFKIAPFSNYSRLIAFTLSNDLGDDIKRFINFNFGSLNDFEIKELQENNIPFEKLEIANINDLASVFQQIESPSTQIYPTQLSAFHNYLFDIEYDEILGDFHVIIGDSIFDFAYYWNKSIFVEDWKRKYINQIWIPSSLANNTEFQNGFKTWLKYMANKINSGLRNVRFVTFSLPKDILNKNLELFTEPEKYTIRRAEVFHKFEYPKFRDYFSISMRDVTSNPPTVTNNSSEQILISKPEEIESGEWVIDLKIAHKFKSARNIQGRDFWITLPRKNFLAYRFIPKEKNDKSFLSRVNQFGQLSTLVSSNDKRILLSFLSETNIVHFCLCLEDSLYFRDDIRSELQKKKFYHVSRSLPGKYLSTLIESMGLYPIYDLFQSRFWRKIFYIMATNKNINQFKENEDNIIQGIKNKLIKYSIKNDNLTWWAKEISKIAKELNFDGKSLPYKAFFTEAQSETEKYNNENPENKIEFDEDDLKGRISDLTASDILHMGLILKCYKCGHKEWFHIDQVRQKTDCIGCGANICLDSEEVWFYRLNTLVKKSVLEGIIPTIIVLGQLLMDSKNSFMFAPSVDLFLSHEDLKIHNKVSNNSFGELDIACVSDGKLIIGEVKLSNSYFDTDKIIRLGRIAEIIKPDYLIFASMDNVPTPRIIQDIKNLNKTLNLLGISAFWYPMHDYIFKPYPVR